MRTWNLISNRAYFWIVEDKAILAPDPLLLPYWFFNRSIKDQCALFNIINRDCA